LQWLKKNNTNKLRQSTSKKKKLERIHHNKIDSGILFSTHVKSRKLQRKLVHTHDKSREVTDKNETYPCQEQKAQLQHTVAYISAIQNDKISQQLQTIEK
jgi:hypothetical protein